MGGRKQPSPPPGEPGYDGPANNFKPAPPPTPPAKRYTEGPWHVESRGTGEYDVITEANGRVAGYMRLADARLLTAALHMRSVLGAILHQLEHGEASDFIDSEYRENVMRASRDDLRWCREQIRAVFKALS